MVVDTAKHAVVVAEEVKNKAEVAEEEAKDAVAAMREAEATEAVEAAKLASSPTKQAGEAAKRALTLYSKIGHWVMSEQNIMCYTDHHL